MASNAKSETILCKASISPTSTTPQSGFPCSTRITSTTSQQVRFWSNHPNKVIWSGDFSHIPSNKLNFYVLW